MRDQVAEDEAVALDHLAGGASDRLGEDRAGVDEGVELAVFATGIDVRRQVGEQLCVVAAPGEGAVERARVDADDYRLEGLVEELLRERGRIASPEGEEGVLARGGEALLAVGADILEEQVAETRSSCSTVRPWWNNV